DIRDGQQLACITCGLCIDACNDMMDKVGKPRGLIDYMALSDEANERAGNKVKHVYRHIFRPRTILYFTLWAALGIALVVGLFVRPDLTFTLRPERNPVYVTMADGSIRNAYEIGVRNTHGEDRPYYVSLGENSPFTVSVQGSDQSVVEVPADTETKVRIYVVAPAGSEEARIDRTPIRIWVRDGQSGDRAFKDSVFNGTGQ
ncbi:MAG: cytochrome c oxidase accessory protein CcoG, partial [Maritimibacter sp.]|nr:cytochrome c oxidase accessory protein CcoG [Maritimibacter sp.]